MSGASTLHLASKTLEHRLCYAELCAFLPRFRFSQPLESISRSGKTINLSLGLKKTSFNQYIQTKHTMAEELTADEISKLCIMLRIINLFHKNLKNIEKLPEMKKEYKSLSSELNEIMRTLTDEQRDRVLKIHKVQLQEIKSK
jgi:hypothetical protein